MAGPSDRDEPSHLRGRLSEVYWPALLSSEANSLALRLGERATLDEPMFGLASGTAVLARTLGEIAAWLKARDATFDNEGLIVGSDREVTEGLLSLSADGRPVVLPVAVLAQKHREREVDLRVYYSTQAFGDAPPARTSALAHDQDMVVPPPVARHLDALARTDLAGVIASFERDATMRGPDGTSYGGPNPRTLRVYFEQLMGNREREGGTTFLKSARADDGTACAVELTVVRLRGREIPPQAALAVYERGDSGLLKAARLYGNIG
jgi:hypothetical protein